MKKIINIFSVILLLMAGVVMTSCSSNDDAAPSDKSQYAFYEPCTQWGASADEVKAYMAKQSNWKELPQDGTSLSFMNEKTLVQIDYTMVNGKLDESTVMYININDKFSVLKQDIKNHYGIELKEYGEMYGFMMYYGDKKIESKNAQISVTVGNAAGIDLMTVTYYK